MGRYTIYRGESAEEVDVAEKVQSVGGRVISARPGLALVETTDAGAARLRKVLKDWKVTRETQARKPTPHPVIKLPPGNRGGP